MGTRTLWILGLALLAGCRASGDPEPRSPSPNPAVTSPQEQKSEPLEVLATAPVPSAPPAPSAPPMPVEPAQAPPDYEQADLDPDNDRAVAPPAPLDGCEQKLDALGAEYRVATLPLKQKRGEVYTCGAEQVVTLLKSPTGIKYNARPTFTCRMALAFVRFETLANEEAARFLGSQVTKVIQVGTYNCRKMARFSLVSEHSYANAIDVQGFKLADGRTVTVKKHFGKPGTEPRGAEGQFLRALARRVFDERVFSVVLTPYWDSLHHDHFHLDLARYRVDGTR